ncbi:MAG: RHS repeat protein [Muribaculaceae bacterium]|nr:RHS repeat protein [Muribaculaceae bacterium]
MTSGRVEYDPFGRAVAVYHPTVDSERVDSFSRAVDNFTPTETEYDELDRPLKVTLPDGTYTTYAYSLVGNALKTTVTDAEGNSSATLTNGSGKTVQSIHKYPLK